MEPAQASFFGARAASQSALSKLSAASKRCQHAGQNVRIPLLWARSRFLYLQKARHYRRYPSNKAMFPVLSFFMIKFHVKINFKFKAMKFASFNKFRNEDSL